MAVQYASTLPGYIAEDTELPPYAKREIENVIKGNLNVTRDLSKAMYPSAKVRVFVDRRRVMLNRVALSAKDFNGILVAIGGRGVMLDFTGYDGPAAEWLVEEALTPIGYIGEAPQLPGN